MNSNENNLDDLTMIKGIGPARQRWLKESLEVRTFGDLAALSVGEIESRLKADKQIASRETIEVWIAEADRRTGKAKRTEKRTRTAKDTKAKEKVKASTEENQAISTPLQSVGGDDGGKAHSPTGRDGWKPFASFIVEYQERTVEGQALEYRTTAHHLESDTNTNWPGIERKQHCRWMLEQLGDRISQERIQELVSFEEEFPAQEGVPESVPVARSPVMVEITQIRAFQPPGADNPVGIGKPDQPFEGHLRGNAPFVLEILFDLIGESAAELAEERAVYRARAYVQDQFTGKSVHLGEVEPGKLVKGKSSYAGMVPHITLPPGMYSLFATVTIQAGSVTPDFITLLDFKLEK